VKRGDKVSDFSAEDQDGRKRSLSELLAGGPLVLFFYPKAMTPG
jgi:peroxiredoxin Q/BCP